MVGRDALIPTRAGDGESIAPRARREPKSEIRHGGGSSVTDPPEGGRPSGCDVDVGVLPCRQFGGIGSGPG